MLVLLAPFFVRSAAGEFIGLTYTARQILTSTTVFRDCTFRGCTGAERGGALYLSNTAVSLGFSDSQFVECEADQRGGAVYAVGCHSFSMNSTSGLRCSTEGFGSFSDVQIWSTEIGSIQLHDLSVTSGRAKNEDTLYFYSDSYMRGNTTVVESVNSSANYAIAGSAFDIGYEFVLSMHFCVFHSNSRGNTLEFYFYIWNNNITCLSLVNNSCQSNEPYPGLIHVRSTIVLSSCVFQSNKYDYFVGGQPGQSSSISFSGCVFDVPTLSTTGRVTLATKGALYETRRTALPECPVVGPHPVVIKGSAYRSVLLGAGSQLELSVESYPTFVIFPTFENLSAAVYDRDNFTVARFAAPTLVLAVYFGLAGGRIVVTAQVKTRLTYFAVKSSWTCDDYVISSSPTERWSASQTKGNFTIGNSQNVCLIHISDSETQVSGVYDTEPGFDALYYQYSWSTSTVLAYTGTGSFAEVSNYLTVFRWSSDEETVSKSFSVQISSPLSSFPNRKAAGSGSSSVPVLLTFNPGPRTRTPSPTRSRQVIPPGGRELAEENGGRLLIPAVGCLVGVVIVAIILVKMVAWKLKERDNPDGESEHEGSQ